MLHFNSRYFLLFVLVFVTEVLIALYVHDGFIRPYFGDVLVVIMLYCFAKSFLKLRVWVKAALVLAFAFAVEGLQYLNLVERMGLADNKIARTIIGTSFAWEDLGCYLAGIALVGLLEAKRK